MEKNLIYKNNKVKKEIFDNTIRRKMINENKTIMEMKMMIITNGIFNIERRD